MVVDGGLRCGSTGEGAVFGRRWPKMVGFSGNSGLPEMGDTEEVSGEKRREVAAVCRRKNGEIGRKGSGKRRGGLTSPERGEIGVGRMVSGGAGVRYFFCRSLPEVMGRGEEEELKEGDWCRRRWPMR
ncbi:hypothetical protein HAX54_022671 [Datura stramonium]|uniref:Uncharacterized protein n=1 Tax=Datura stramonium TaxID=4076 RepID=A0ABS8S498_DATST|nr:hypothetical protein [Datura stramonium]